MCIDMWFGGQSEVGAFLYDSPCFCYFTFMCMGVCICLVPEELEEGVRLTAAGVRDGYEVPREY